MSSPVSAVDLVFVYVSDQGAALAFYRDRLGFEVRTDEAYGDGQRWIEVLPPGAKTAVALIGGGVPAGEEPSPPVASFATDDIERSHAVLGEGGVPRSEIIAADPPAPAMFYFSDPDGNNFLIVDPER